MISLRKARLALLVLPLIGYSGGCASAADAPPPDAQEVSETEARSVSALLTFMAMNGTLDGAASVCDPIKEAIIRQCTVLEIRNWNTISGLPAIPHLGPAITLGTTLWKQAYENAKKRQSEVPTPVPCSQIENYLANAPALQLCGPVPGGPLAQAPQPGSDAGMSDPTSSPPGEDEAPGAAPQQPSTASGGQSQQSSSSDEIVNQPMQVQ